MRYPSHDRTVPLERCIERAAEPLCIIIKVSELRRLWWSSGAQSESETNMGTLCPASGSPTFDSAPLYAMVPLSQPATSAQGTPMWSSFSQSGGPESRYRPTRENCCIVSSFFCFIFQSTEQPTSVDRLFVGAVGRMTTTRASGFARKTRFEVYLRSSATHARTRSLFW